MNEIESVDDLYIIRFLLATTVEWVKVNQQELKV